MTISPYDSLPSGNSDIQSETPKTPPAEYTEVDLKEFDIAPTKPAPPPKPIKTKPLSAPPHYTESNLKNFCGCTEFILPFEEPLLVPDTMVDMRDVLFAEGRVDISPIGKTTYDKNDLLSGNITVFTVYKPVSSSYSPAAGPAAFNDCPVEVVKSVIPFKTDKCWGNTEGDSFRLDVTLKGVSSEMLNERKFIVRGEILIKIYDICDRKLMHYSESSDSDILTYTKSLQATVLKQELSDTVDISQEISLKEDQPFPIKILKTSLNIVENHRQITSGKLILNSCIHSQILYLGEKDDGQWELCCTTGKTDFSQFILVNEDTHVDLIKLIFRNDLDVVIEGNRFLLSGNVTTMIQSYDNKALESVSDAYHKKEELLFDLHQTVLDHVSGVVSGEVSNREVISLSEEDKKPAVLLCGSCSIVSLEGFFSNGQIIVSGTVKGEVLALDSENSPFMLEHTIPIRCSLEIAESKLTDPKICINAVVKDFWFSEINTRQIELNSTLGITAWAITKEPFCTIDNLRFADSDTPASGPAMGIYVVAAGESLWDVAKRYKCDISHLAAMNDLDPKKPVPDGTKLFFQKYV